jgi:hypothetical protein
MKVEIDTRDLELRNSLMSGTPVDLGNDVRLNYEGVAVIRKGFDFPSTIELAFQFGLGVSSGVAANLLTNWLWSRKGRVEKIQLEKTEIDFDDKGNINKIVNEKIEKTTRPD